MKAGLDSSIDRPNLEQARAARAAGVRIWGGYLPPGVGLESPWDQASFQVVQEAGLVAIGFASGNDDPAEVAATAQAWKVRGCLDDEDGIRAEGSWVQTWLDASGFGLYGLAAVHAGRRAAYHVVADYPGSDPGATWPSWLERPPTPTGWQWQGTHDEFGLSVDRSWFDDWFVRGGKAMTISCARPDGGRDWYTLVDEHLEHTVTDFSGVITFADSLPGSWSGLIACGYRGTLPFVQGTGTDIAHSRFECADPGPGWVLSARP